MFLVQVCPNIAWDIPILKKYLLFIWNSDLTDHPAFLFAKSDNPNQNHVEDLLKQMAEPQPFQFLIQ